MVTYGHNTIGKPIDLRHSHLASAFFLALIPDNIGSFANPVDG